MSNFDFLRDFDETLYKLGNRIENEVSVAPSAVKADATPFLEYLLNKLLNRIGLKFNYRKDFYSQLDTVYRKGLIDYNFKDKIYDAYMQRNRIHDSYEEMVKNELVVAIDIHKKLFYIAKKYYNDFNENDDEYKGVPSFKPIELDTFSDEIEQVEIPDFTEIIDFTYDTCVICGKANHSSYSLCCPECSRILDNANNFISIWNYFGKDAQFTKEDLIEYGIPEGYVNQLVTHLAQENVLSVSGRFIRFNNMYFDRYMTQIYDFLTVGELITKFREDNITPSEIKQTREYKEGSLHNKPFYEFYKIINDEIINKFERDILATENIWESIDYSTITQKQLERWYLKNLGFYKKGQANESFEAFNNLLMIDYIELKRQGIPESDIKSELNISSRVYDFWLEINDSFETEINQIKRDLILKALNDGKTEAEAIAIAGITPHEFDTLYKISHHYNDGYALEIDKEFEARRLRLISYLESMSLESACKFAKITVDDFYKWYDSSKLNSPFYLDSTRILMDKFLDERKKGKAEQECLNNIGLKEKYLGQWLTRSLEICRKFNDENLRVNVNLVLRGFKWKKTKKEISEMFDIKIEVINRFLSVGEKGSEMYKELFEYYEENIIPLMLEKFLQSIQTKPLQKALEYAELTENELDKYYQLGHDGDVEYKEFYERYHEFKVDEYVSDRINGKKHINSMKRANLSNDEFDELKDSLDKKILHKRIDIVKKEILNDSTAEKAAKIAGVSFDDVYDWYFNGKTDEEFSEFSEFFFSHYIEPNVLYINNMIDDGKPIDKILRVFDINLTQRDFDIWQSEGLINTEDVLVNLDKKDDEDEKEEFNLFKHDGFNSKLFNSINKDVDDSDGIKPKDVFFQKKRPSKSPSILSKDDDYDVEKLKKQILKK